MVLKDFLTSYMSELLCTEYTSLSYAYSQVNAVPRLRVPIILYLAVTKEQLDLAPSDAKELETVCQALAEEDGFPPEYQKLLDYYNYLIFKSQKHADLMARLKAAVIELMQLKSITADKLAALVDTKHTMDNFTMQEYSRALHLLKTL